jgi:hypothetical protein
LEFTFGRLSGADDEGLIQQLAASSKNEGTSIRELEAMLVSSPAFLSRIAEKSP